MLVKLSEATLNNNMTTKNQSIPSSFQASCVARLGHYVWDTTNDKCVYCSEQHAKLHGLSVDEYLDLSSTVNGLAHPEDLNVVRQAFEDLKNGKTFEIEYRLLRPDGSIRFVREIGHPVFDDTGRVVHEVGTSQDITNEVNLRAEIAASEKRYRSLFEQSPIPFMEEDWTKVLKKLKALGFTTPASLSKFLKENPAEVEQLYDACETKRVSLKFAQLYGAKSVEEFQPLLRYSKADKDEINGFTDALVKFYFGEFQISYKATETQLDGSPITTRITFSIPEEHSANWDRILISAENITEENNRELALRKAQHFEAIGQISSSIAHDFNNVLTIVNGAAEFLLMSEEHSVEILNEIIEAGERGAALVSQMLSYASAQSTKPEIIHVGELIQNMQLLLSKSFGKHFGFSVEIGEGDLRAVVDQGLLKDAVMNLLLNSRDAMPQGGELTLRVRMGVKEPASNVAPKVRIDQKYVEVSISDTGKGMTAATIAKATEPFFSTKKHGTGLGLSSVSGFIKQANGTLSIESKIDFGSTVTMYLPAADPQIRDIDRSKNSLLTNNCG